VKFLARTLIVIALAFILQTILGYISPILSSALNLLSVVVLYFAVLKGEIYGAVTGTVCGLLQDSFSLGVLGVAGIAKTIAGFAAGAIAQKINIAPISRRYAFFATILTIELLIWMFLYGAVYSQRVPTAGGLLFLQPFLTALAASGIFPLGDRLQSLWERRGRT
jgi:rod shape-determining protein MreD